ARDHAREFDVVTVTRAVAIHARQKDLTGAETLRAHGPFNRVPANGAAATVRVDFPTTLLTAARGDGNYNTLAAKRLCAGFDQIRIFNRGGVQSDLVGAGSQDGTDVFH